MEDEQYTYDVLEYDLTKKLNLMEMIAPMEDRGEAVELFERKLHNDLKEHTGIDSKKIAKSTFTDTLESMKVRVM